MMQPEFDDLIEYVRAGESDPEMQELLTGYPDGQELLKQARFICKVLQDRYGDSSDIGNVADADMAWYDLDGLDGLDGIAAKMSERREPDDRGARTSSQSQSFRELRPRRSTPVEYLLAGIDVERQNLGTLRFVVDEQRVLASYQPSLFVDSYARKFLRNIRTSQLGGLGLQIQSMDVNISLPASTAVGETIPLRLSRSVEQTPARNLELIFMPESGPFVRFASDGEGYAALPAPIQGGVLRIGLSTPRFLRIEVETS